MSKHCFFCMTVCMLLTSLTALKSQDWPQQGPAWVDLLSRNYRSQWVPKIAGYELGDNYKQTFLVGKGKIRVHYKGYDSFGVRYGHLFYKQPFSFYVLRVEYRFLGEQAKGGQGWATRNSGIMIHGQDPGTMGKNQDFPISLEVQLLGGLGNGTRTTANLCTPGTQVVMNGNLLTEHCTNSSSQTFHGDQWVQVEVLVLGDSLIRHKVNGETVMEYTKPVVGGAMVNQFIPSAKQDGMALKGGYISLQSESHPIEFRKVEILNLVGCKDPAASNYSPYAVREDKHTCIYVNKK
jgi:hypothetical protein